MSKLKAFFADHKISTHAVAVIFAAAFTAYKEVPEFHALVLAGYNHLPSAVQSAATAALALYAWYRNGQK